MKVYIVMTEDRHVDVELELYRDKKEANERARYLVYFYGSKYPESIEEETTDGLYHGVYSCEGDRITVLEKEIEGKS
jgi:hypothetical protein